MIRLELTIIGNDELIAKLRNAATKAPRVMDEATYRWGQSVRAKLKSTPYPPKRPNQRYVRTGRLANSWRAERVSQSRTVITNSAAYSGYVVGNSRGERQAWFHRGRWWRARDVIAESRPELKASVLREMDRLLK